MEHINCFGRLNRHEAVADALANLLDGDSCQVGEANSEIARWIEAAAQSVNLATCHYQSVLLLLEAQGRLRIERNPDRAFASAMFCSDDTLYFTYAFPDDHAKQVQSESAFAPGDKVVINGHLGATVKSSETKTAIIVTVATNEGDIRDFCTDDTTIFNVTKEFKA